MSVNNCNVSSTITTNPPSFEILNVSKKNYEPPTKCKKKTQPIIEKKKKKLRLTELHK